MSAHLRREGGIRASAIIGAPSELWPCTFAACERHRMPLALGIHKALFGAVAPAITTGTNAAPDIKTALRRSVTSDGYLQACRRLAAIIEYNVRVSSREAYISPTRGRQGNALKTILPMAYVVGGKVRGETWIEAHGRKHRLIFSVYQMDKPTRDKTRGLRPAGRLRTMGASNVPVDYRRPIRPAQGRRPAVSLSWAPRGVS